MLNQLLKILTPELIIQAVKDNPKVIMDTLQKFDTFKLLGQSLTPELQIVLSNNGKYVNDYLSSEDGKAAARLWAEGFAEFVAGIKNKAQAVIDAAKAEEDAKIAAAKAASELEIAKVAAAAQLAEDIQLREVEAAKVREEDAKLRAELEAKIRKEIEETMRKEMLDARLAAEELQAKATKEAKALLDIQALAKAKALVEAKELEVAIATLPIKGVMDGTI